MNSWFFDVDAKTYERVASQVMGAEMTIVGNYGLHTQNYPYPDANNLKIYKLFYVTKNVLRNKNGLVFVK